MLEEKKRERSGRKDDEDQKMTDDPTEIDTTIQRQAIHQAGAKGL